MKPIVECNSISIFGYSGHAFVVCDILIENNIEILGYLTENPVSFNPYRLDYLGFEGKNEDLIKIKECGYFVSIGSNRIRQKLIEFLERKLSKPPINVISKSVQISDTVILKNGIMISKRTIINSLSKIETGVICNSGCIIEHECHIGSYSHIAPGAVLCGNVSVGMGSLVGANSVIKEGVSIGNNVIIGAGSVVLNNVDSNQIIAGSPARYIRSLNPISYEKS